MEDFLWLFGNEIYHVLSGREADFRGKLAVDICVHRNYVNVNTKLSELTAQML